MTGTMAVGANGCDVINGIRTALIKRGDVVDLKESTAILSREWTGISAQLAITLGALKSPAHNLEIASEYVARHPSPPLLGFSITRRLLGNSGKFIRGCPFGYFTAAENRLLL
jgi:hypothetical protein